MSHWHYQIVDHGDYVAMHEVYYDRLGLWAYTTEPCQMVADNAGDLQDMLRMMVADANKHGVRSVASLDEEIKRRSPLRRLGRALKKLVSRKNRRPTDGDSV